MYAKEKGLDNRFGENNCFLNVVIQSLWHLDSFRTKFIDWDSHKHQEDNNCVHCSLKIIFTQYSFSETPSLPPTPLRNTLHELFVKELKFQKFSIDDAAEAFEAVLSCLKNTIREGDKDIPKQVFEIESKKTHVCKTCSTPANDENNAQFIEYTYATTLRNLRAQYPQTPIEKLIFLSSLEIKGCPKDNNPCRERNYVTRKIANIPEVLALGLVWETPEPSQFEIQSTFNLFGQSMDIGAVFNLNDVAPADLKGMICYWGKHYNSYFYSQIYRKWLVFDDSTVKIVGTLEDVKNRCLLGHFHPSVLFYERRPGTYTPKTFVMPRSVAPQAMIIPQKIQNGKLHQVTPRARPTLNFSLNMNPPSSDYSPPLTPENNNNNYVNNNMIINQPSSQPTSYPNLINPSAPHSTPQLYSPNTPMLNTPLPNIQSNPMIVMPNSPNPNLNINNKYNYNYIYINPPITSPMIQPNNNNNQYRVPQTKNPGQYAVPRNMTTPVNNSNNNNNGTPKVVYIVKKP